MKLLKPVLIIATMTVAVSTHATSPTQQSTSHHQGEYYLQDQNAQVQSRSLTNPVANSRQTQHRNQERHFKTQQETAGRSHYYGRSPTAQHNSQDMQQEFYTTQQEITNNGPYGDAISSARLEPLYRNQQDATHGLAYQQFNNENENMAYSGDRQIASESQNDEFADSEFSADTHQDTVTQRYHSSRSVASENTTATGTAAAAVGTEERSEEHKSKKAKNKKAKKNKNIKADNSGMNKKHHSAKKTADDQSNNPSDVEMTRRIRAEIMNKENLSTYAKNVKILVKDNEVVLRGPVRTADERSQIAEVASSVAQDHQIKNELEVVAR